jgi:hypothetical protein
MAPGGFMNRLASTCGPRRRVRASGRQRERRFIREQPHLKGSLQTRCQNRERSRRLLPGFLVAARTHPGQNGIAWLACSLTNSGMRSTVRDVEPRV